ncbi:PP2C family protein-serine/threonine phosphatase [Paenibacillus sp. NEAU-GSW1]|uniref:PP2C family protein-serine/threonine phosphatase n=1 Tax=Paenibacillus sp. NEAU-GSW1 TaxID=2682486 RepID=UPI0012E29089|nr:PP2C family protein-serine/threonine phosphatase [Paenibacillus sp. NEAU-GSW1]MUT67117.1 SpoIIE family protein phosphatase [Paenibacillus sp. NEAU-GSW1]
MTIAGWIAGAIGLGAAAALWIQNRRLSAKIKQSDLLFELSSQIYSAKRKEELLLAGEEGIKRLVDSEEAAIVLADQNGGLTGQEQVSVPLEARGRRLGMLQASGKAGGQRLTAAERDLLAKLSGPLALALDNAMLHEVTEESVNELQEATALKERLESELQIAGSIQLSFLPTTMPSANEPFDVCALLKSAKEVGGDFYNFFKIDEDHLFFTLGDVSDKGIPAALFMAMTLSLLKGKMNPDLSPGELLKKVNDELCLDNAQLFATIVCGVLKISTGEAVLSDGGHCTPYMVKANGEVLPIKLAKGIPLGSFPEFIYKNVSLQLERGDKLIIYTDGITEAENALQEQYSAGRLQRFLAQTKEYSSAEIIDALLMDVFMFADGAPQSDDIAVLCLTRR